MYSIILSSNTTRNYGVETQYSLIMQDLQIVKTDVTEVYNKNRRNLAGRDKVGNPPHPPSFSLPKKICRLLM
jgi:hypothetical protein